MRPAHYSDEDLEQHSLCRRVADNGQRSGFEHDVDRILYSTQWRALAGKSQVVASAELGAYHTRLTHSMKVAQLGRRMAERLERRYGGPNPALVEAACMAHDIGHPPFGHAGETALRATMDELHFAAGVLDSFEGNAQTLHILTFLAAHKHGGHRGLHLTRACLDAATKYPWERAPRDTDRARHAKWGVYAVDRQAFAWVRAGRADEAVPVEEQVMDWADDVTYACHDVEDFYRTGLIPLAALFPPPGAAGGDTERETQRFLDYVAAKRRRAGAGFDRDEALHLLADIAKALSIAGPYSGRHADDVAVNARTAKLIDHFTRDIELEVTGTAAIRYGARLVVPAERRAACELLKELVWCYVIDRPALATQQHGKRRIVSELLRWTHDSPRLLPADRAEELELHGDALRAAADHIASLTEDQAIALHRRLSGTALGSVSDNVWL
ncbi:deoxyguanosinetriphosphate triphosphohydrolase family protein [Streptomyces silvensis]|uniref:Deoxyguanosinetriphosphate triphosphohydrolase n=1 Tax=Streptomyces silvensis TaxID=1765722 RepID=A0A0W7X5J1_9ACTN|nr:dNTP triphosphohydrolase [Streptomyces silvensis]KUF18080.1 deoxyguanosinetriphosphate triphosphohydrolase [Streptomyces silvensis]